MKARSITGAFLVLGGVLAVCVALYGWYVVDFASAPVEGELRSTALMPAVMFGIQGLLFVGLGIGLLAWQSFGLRIAAATGAMLTVLYVAVLVLLPQLWLEFLGAAIGPLVILEVWRSGAARVG